MVGLVIGANRAGKPSLSEKQNADLRDLIQALKGRGWSDAAIGQAAGKDTSAINRVVAVERLRHTRRDSGGECVGFNGGRREQGPRQLEHGHHLTVRRWATDRAWT